MKRSPQLSHPMTLLAAGLAFSSLAGCQRKTNVVPSSSDQYGTCVTPATVRDLTGLDGCGMVLELAGGKRLGPVGPLWVAFASTPGQRVFISYEPFDGASACMAGKLVTITCIRAADANGN